MTTRLVVLADRIVAPLRSSDRSHLAPVLKLAERAAALFETAPIVLLGFRRQELLDLFCGCLFLNNPTHLTTRVPETYLECLKYIPAQEDVLFVEADADMSPDVLESLTGGGSGLQYAPSLAKPHFKLTNLFIRVEQREQVESILRAAERDYAAMLARLEAELPILMTQSYKRGAYEAHAMRASGYYDQQ